MENNIINANCIKERLNGMLGKSMVDEDTFDCVERLLSGIVFDNNKSCDDGYVLKIGNGSTYETDESIGLSSNLMPRFTGITEQDGIVYVLTDFEEEVEIEDLENQVWNLYWLFDDLIGEYGDWSVIVVE